MRVLLLDYEYPPFGGGAGAATQAFARGLAARGVMVDVVTGGDREERTTELLWNGTAAEEGLLTVYRVKTRRTAIHLVGLGGALSYLRAALPEVRRRLRDERYDVLHLFSPLPTAALLPLLDLRGLPVVVSLRGSDVPGYHAHPSLLARASHMLGPFTRWTWRRADRVVAVSESVGHQALRTLPGLRYSVVPNGVELTCFRPPHRRTRPRARIRCLAVARLVERKGLADLIRAIGMLERGRYELEILGTGAEEEALRGLVADLGLGDRVTFSGSLDRGAIARRYREADLFTLAPREEAFGNAFAEAMASGLPVVASDVGGVPELVRHGENGLLVRPRDPLALAAAIRNLADHPRLREEMGRRNRAQAEANLSWERVTARYLSIYNGVQRRAPAHRALAELPSSTW
ncbi:MAG: glycosyltransferase family 4 protein [Gemmatimonadales bacterium]|nr:glycosyltransferase family 4 protein [Gemmatimonadales bacterium]